MARKNRPPQHRADVPGVFIPKNDSSFDKDRYDREIAKMKSEGLDINQHPIERYYAGKTRYDLQAPEVLFGASVCAGDYFKLDEPEKFLLRRLNWDQWHRVLALIDSGAFLQGQLAAARFGVSEVQNSTLKLEGAQAGLLTHEDMQAMFETDSALPSVLGQACWSYSRPLTDSEKKA